MNESVSGLSAEESDLLQKARKLFAAGRYPQAAELFKELLNRSDNSDYRDQLAQCYLQWALNTAGQGRLKQAGPLWEAYAAYAQTPLVAQDKYISWLLAEREFSKAYPALEKLGAAQLDHQFPELAVLLGFLLVSGNTALASHLPPDSALFRHWQFVKAALAAYRDGRFEACKQALKSLPYRSAFRDFRILLRAQLCPDPAEAQLSKIPESSPYRSAADAAIASLQAGAELVASLAKLEPHHRRVVAIACGLSANQIQLVETVSGESGWLTDKVRFYLALQYRSLFGPEAAQAFCLGRLAHYPDGFQDYLNYFGTANAFEENRIHALLCEKAKNSHDAQRYWRRCIEILQGNGTTENRKIAMILRHMAALVPREEAVDLLVESLDYDAAHKESYLGILTFYGLEQPDSAQYEHWLERSLKGFPHDVDILVNAVKSAAKRKSIGQIREYARALLNIDPANKTAKQQLFGDYVAQARRLISSENYAAAEERLQSAEQCIVEKEQRAQLDLLRGVYCRPVQERGQFDKQTIDALEKLGDDPVSKQFQLLMESALLNRPCPVSLPVEDAELTSRQLKHLIALIEYYDEQSIGGNCLAEALNQIGKPVKHSIARLAKNEALMLSWCGVLERVGHFDLLRHCVALAGEPDKKPIWLYYKTLAGCHGDVSRLDHITLFQLQNAMAEARAENDSKAVLLIGRLIERSQIASDPFVFKQEVSAVDSHSQSEDLYEALFGHIPAEAMEKLERKVRDIMLETDPVQFAEQAMRRYAASNDIQTLRLLFDDPDFFASAALLEAAEQLQIDIGVAMKDVVARFTHTLS
ncbi:tetratricopeptide repeat protein [Methylomonas sp. MgM2]